MIMQNEIKGWHRAEKRKRFEKYGLQYSYEQTLVDNGFIDASKINLPFD
jgi:hypothetical protein